MNLFMKKHCNQTHRFCVKKLWIFFLLFGLSHLTAQDNLTAVTGETSYEFWLHTPDIQEEKAPLIVFLHGRSLSGTDLERVKRYGILKGLMKNIKELNKSIIVAPQLPSGPWNADKVDEIVQYIIKNQNVDESRIYITGMSLGSYGTMEYVTKYPERVAAAVSICGGAQSNDMCNATSVPIRLIHGDNDKAVRLSESKKVFDKVKNCNKKAPIELQIVKGGTHGSVEDFYRHPEIYQWMFQYQKSQTN